MRAAAPVVLLSALLAACGGGNSSVQSTLPTGAEAIHLDPASFVDRIDNAYWPMKPGSRWTYREVNDDGSEQAVEVTVTDRVKRIMGIPATVVHDVVTEDSEVIEDTLDWYAQDTDGNVWYLGEDTKEYENGKVTSTEGSWQAGVDGAQAGVVMPADPRVGLEYRQEYYAGHAEDRGKVVSTDSRTEVPFGSFENLLETEDTTPLEPDVREHKFYATGVGNILSVSGGGREELIRYVPG